MRSNSLKNSAIVAHDKFQEIIDYANSPDSVIRGGMKVMFVTDERSKTVTAQPKFMEQISVADGYKAEQKKFVFENQGERDAAAATFDIIRREYERLPTSADLTKPEIQKEIVAKVEQCIVPAQQELNGVVKPVDVADIVLRSITLRNELSIDIPRITVQPVGNVTRGYREFKLDMSNVHLLPVENEILIQELHRREQYRLMSGVDVVPEAKPEDYLVRGLIDFNDISYDDHAALLYALTGQAVAHLRTYLKDEGEVLNLLRYHQPALVNLIHTQMQEHFVENAVAYEAHVSKGFTTLRPTTYIYQKGEAGRDFRVPLKEKQDIRKMVFSDFSKCLYLFQKFDSDSERRFAVILENDREVLKWFKPAKNDFRIHCSGDTAYEPDFVVETASTKFLCEPKAAAEMSDKDVQSKARAAVEWCKHATKHETKHGGKPWTYLLIPHDVISDDKTLQGLSATYRLK